MEHLKTTEDIWAVVANRISKCFVTNIRIHDMNYLTVVANFICDECMEHYLNKTQIVLEMLYEFIIILFSGTVLMLL